VFFDDNLDAGHVVVPTIDGEYSERDIKYHLRLMYQAGFLDCEPVKSSTSDRVIYVIPFDLTWDGHEFLAKIRSDGVWQKIRSAVSSSGGTLAFAVINQLATKLALHAAGL
jgi:hypothetical protein